MGGLGTDMLVSWCQKAGTLPRTCTKAAKPPKVSSTICSLSTSFATWPASFSPRFR
jgi:hypothetical protein